MPDWLEEIPEQLLLSLVRQEELDAEQRVLQRQRGWPGHPEDAGANGLFHLGAIEKNYLEAFCSKINHLITSICEVFGIMVQISSL